MSTTDWKDVTIILANGEKRPAKACYVGDGWCDVIVESDGLTARMWVLADGSASPPMNPCRLAEPFPLTALPQASSVTPAERTAAVMLRAWQAWQPDATDPEPVRHMLAMFGVNAAHAGLVYAETDDLTPAGRELLARVEAAERTPDPLTRRCPVCKAVPGVGCITAPHSLGARYPLRKPHRARLAGTTPIDAPPRREPER